MRRSEEEREHSWRFACEGIPREDVDVWYLCLWCLFFGLTLIEHG